MVKKFISIVLFVLFSAYNTYAYNDRNVERLIKAIGQVESRGNVNAVSNCGKFVGYLQISKVVVDDCNRILGEKKYNYNHRFDKESCHSPGRRNKYPPAKPGVLHKRVKPWITSARVTSRWYGLPAAKDCYLPPVNGPFRSFPLLAVRLPGLLLTGAGCILLSFYRFSLLYPHSILCTRTPYCDT